MCTKTEKEKIQGQSFCLLAIILFITSALLQTSHFPVSNEFLPPLIPQTLKPENPLNRGILTLFYTIKILSVLLLTLGIANIAQSHRLSKLLTLFLCLFPLSITLQPFMTYPSLLLTFSLIFIPQKPPNPL